MANNPLLVDRMLDLSGASIDELTIGDPHGEKALIVGSYRIDDMTNIPDALRTLLEQYTRID